MRKSFQSLRDQLSPEAQARAAARTADMLKEMNNMNAAEQLIADVLAEYADELDKAACDRCEQCRPHVMCSFHSVLSALQRHTITNAELQRRST